MPIVSLCGLRLAVGLVGVGLVSAYKLCAEIKDMIEKQEKIAINVNRFISPPFIVEISITYESMNFKVRESPGRSY